MAISHGTHIYIVNNSIKRILHTDGAWEYETIDGSQLGICRPAEGGFFITRISHKGYDWMLGQTMHISAIDSLMVAVHNDVWSRRLGSGDQ